jgi:hypothetical protein
MITRCKDCGIEDHTSFTDKELQCFLGLSVSSATNIGNNAYILMKHEKCICDFFGIVHVSDSRMIYHTSRLL